METVLLPDINRIKSVVQLTIDTFSTWCEVLESNFSEEPTEVQKQQISYVRESVNKYKSTAGIAEVDQLFDLLKDVLSNVADERKDQKLTLGQLIRRKFMQLTSNGHKIVPKPTFDEQQMNRFKHKVYEMKADIEYYKRNCSQLQKQHQVCWLSESKESELDFSMSARRNERDQIIGQLKPKEQRTREKTDAKIYKKLQFARVKANEDVDQYQELFASAVMRRNAIQTYQKNILRDIRFDLIRRIESGIMSLNRISTKYASKNELSELITNTNSLAASAANSIIDKICYKYSFRKPQEFRRKNEFEDMLRQEYLLTKASTEEGSCQAKNSMEGNTNIASEKKSTTE